MHARGIQNMLDTKTCVRDVGTHPRVVDCN